MSMRNRLLGLAGVLAVAGAVSAKPPGTPVEPLVEGREPTPIARDFHEATPSSPPLEAVAGSGSAGLPTTRPTPEPVPLPEFVTGLRDAFLYRLTIPLGTVSYWDH